MTALHRHAGVPDKWINSRGHDVTPPEICRGCWQTGATDIDRCGGGCEYRYHPVCYLAQQIRGDLRLAAHARIRGEADRAVEMERAALGKHIEWRALGSL
jgi:hypothetical protein